MGSSRFIFKEARSAIFMYFLSWTVVYDFQYFNTFSSDKIENNSILA